MSDKTKPLSKVADVFRKSYRIAKAATDAIEAKQAAKANEADMKIRYGTLEAATRTRKSRKKRQELKEAFKLFQK